MIINTDRLKIELSTADNYTSNIIIDAEGLFVGNSKVSELRHFYDIIKGIEEEEYRRIEVVSYTFNLLLAKIFKRKMGLNQDS